MLFVTPVLLAATELPQGAILSFDKNLLVNLGVQLLNIAILTFVLGWFLYKPVVKYLHTRAERIRNEIDAVRRDRDEALALKEKYEELVAGIEMEREQVLHQAYKMAMEKSDQMLFDARREAGLVFDRTLQELEVEKKNQADEMKRQIIDIAVLMAGKIIEDQMDQDAHDRIFSDSLAEWRKT